MTRFRHLNVEALEERAVPATWNNPWPDASQLTLSFVPDGTAIGPLSSNLFSTLSGSTSASWRLPILRAFQSWAIHANINLGIVPDSGDPLGSAGRPQGDPRFGDIRIAGSNYSREVLAFSSPFDITATTWSGDVRINSSLWSNSPARFDLFTAMLQEAGHVFGLNNSGDPSSVMFEEYLGLRSGPSAADIAALQALYGPRRHDAHEGSRGNDTLATATRLGWVTDADGVLSLGVQADLTTSTDRDLFTFQAPTLTSRLQIRLERAGLSLVTPRVTVFDGSGRVLASVQSLDPLGEDLTLQLDRVAPLARLYVQIEGVGEELFRVGGYRLSLRSLPLVNSLSSNLLSTVNSLGESLTRNDLHTNDSFLTATNLLGSLFAPTTTFDVAYHASISDKWDRDYYQVQAPATAAGDNVLSVMAWGTGRSAVLPQLTLFDASRNPIPVEVLVNSAGVVAIQAVGVTPGATYYILVDSPTTGDYFLGVDFGSRAVKLKTFAESTVDSSRPSTSGELTIHRTGLFHFVLDSFLTTTSAVELSIRDSTGSLVATILANQGESVSLTQMFAPGTYSFTFHTLDHTSSGTQGAFRLRGDRISDPIGPQAMDTTEESSGSYSRQGSGSGSSSGSGSVHSDSSGTQHDSPVWYYDYYWYAWSYEDDTSSGGVQSQEGSSGYRA